MTQLTYQGRDWRGRAKEDADQMFATFRKVERLMAALWYLREAASLSNDARSRNEARGLCELLEATLSEPPPNILDFDLTSSAPAIDDVLSSASVEARASYKRRFERRDGDLAGADLRGRDLRGADLRGACLIGADLRGVDLTRADLLGADMRDAQLAEADLANAIFLVQPQLDGAIGSPATRIPDWAMWPRGWRHHR